MRIFKEVCGKGGIARGAILKNCISLLCSCHRVEVLGTDSVIHEGRLNFIHQNNLIEALQISRKHSAY